jgi:AcrR family transcriptional regulator
VAKAGSGLREQQRLRRRTRILEAAGVLFTEEGFDETSMEQLADKAEVSVPTIYGYFSSKSELLLGLLEIDTKILWPRIEKILSANYQASHRDPLKAIVSLVLVETTEGYDLARKRVWREISAAAYRAPMEQRQAFISLQNARSDALLKLLVTLRDAGHLRRDLDCVSASLAIHAIARNGFRLYLMHEDATLSDLATQMRRQISVVLDGMRSKQPDDRADRLSGRPPGRSGKRSRTMSKAPARIRNA